CHQREFPDPSTAGELYDILIIGGSHYSSYDTSPAWIPELAALLPVYVACGLRVVGCCFGHQIMAK
ncbi:hypothetical protein TSOC_015175, partial [Tetrabaena socialis]